MQDIEDALLEKLQALLRLARNEAATEHEASLAMERAHSLLLKHGLEMADVEGATNGDGPAVLEEAWDGFTGQDWIPTLVNIIGRNNYCRVILSKPKLLVIGRRHNVMAVHEMSLWLIQQVGNLAAADWGAREFTGETNGLSEREWRQSFTYGVTNRISERLRQQRAEEKGQRSDVQALVVRYDDENKDYIRENYPNLARAVRVGLNTEAYQSGVRAGDGISISPGSRQVRGGE